jgi:hypothetical protein
MLYLIELTRQTRDMIDYLIGCDRRVTRRYIPDAPYMLVFLPTDFECAAYIRCMGGAYMVPANSKTLVY